jgi:predicted NBD/HSP70 family sugar kinase
MPGLPARPQLMRTLNEQLLLDHIRTAGRVSRAELSRISGLAKNTVSLLLANLERARLVRPSGTRTGVPGPAALLYEVHPEAGYVLGLDVGRQYLRGAVSDFAGTVRARSSVPARSTGAAGRIAQLTALADSLLAQVGLAPGNITQTVLGTPGIYDPGRDAIILAPALSGWDRPQTLAALRDAFGSSLMIENDVDAAALAEGAHGHGQDVDSFAFVSVGTGVGMGLVLNGRLHRGAHGAAGEIGYLPFDGLNLEAVASAAGIVRSARDNGVRAPASARGIFAAAGRGDEQAARVVAGEALLVARAVCAVVTVVDPELIVLGGGVGQAEGFLQRVEHEMQRLVPVHPRLRTSALGVDAVVDGCLVAGLEQIWEQAVVSP